MTIPPTSPSDSGTSVQAAARSTAEAAWWRSAALLGHASIRTTYDVYGHLFKGRDRAAADALETARTRSLADFPRTPDGLGVTPLSS